ncbi:Heavy metal tolerance protein [Erysiphe neolycopersici]|uniref:Heavy metal tolerance protein n=1 Tax=Erysiphe neolycopersici TaxID=212602 RepID=A0A420HG94_9PEZI|nr:Heavy metal tolerance protein [Erysiphe neolycopersici]
MRLPKNMILLSIVGFTAEIQIIVKTIHYAFPILALLYFLTASIIAFCTMHTAPIHQDNDYVGKKFIIAWISTVTFVYLPKKITQAIRHVAQGIMTGIYLEQDEMVYMIMSGVTYGVEALVLIEYHHPSWHPYSVTWKFAFIVEFSLMIIHHASHCDPKFHMVSLFEQITRVSLFLILFIHIYYHKIYRRYLHLRAEWKLIFSSKTGPKSINLEGFPAFYPSTNGESINKNGSSKQDEKNELSSMQYGELNRNTGKQVNEAENWIFLPYIWPFKEKKLQLRAVLVIFCLVGSSILNVLVPRQMGAMIDSLTRYAQGDHTYNIWLPSIIYIALRFANGSSGISLLQKWLWNPIEQYSYGALTTASHSHMMNLSSDFHDSKITSDLIQAIFGGRSIS